MSRRQWGATRVEMLGNDLFQLAKVRKGKPPSNVISDIIYQIIHGIKFNLLDLYRDWRGGSVGKSTLLLSQRTGSQVPNNYTAAHDCL